MPSKKRRYSIFHKEKRRRKYSYTRTKATIAFLLSVIFSVLLAPFFDRYAPVMFHHIGEGFNDFLDMVLPVDETAQHP